MVTTSHIRHRSFTLHLVTSSPCHLVVAFVLAGLAACQTQPPAPTPLSAPTVTPPALMMGVSWYPEQWPESRWEADLQLMQDANVHMIRLGEFAWSTMEPAEGRYDLAWLDRAVAMAARHGMVTVMCTPTDAPPAWLTSKYPDTLRVDENGVRLRHGGRRQFSYTSPRYREFCRKIVDQMAARFAANPNVIGWQIGNEFTDDSADDSAKKLWTKYLANKFQTLDNMNAHWATAYWSQTYSAWDQVPFPKNTDNPGLRLEYQHFVTENSHSFIHVPSNAIRAYFPVSAPCSDFIPPNQFITTNLGGLGWAIRFDRWQINKDLDLATWDTYIGNDGHLEPYKIGASQDLVRGWKRKNFWVMETQPGSVNWAGVNNTLDKGETREVAWQAVGHGADCVAYWQWRSALNGQEQYHGGLIGPDGSPLPIYDEIKQIGQEFAKAAPALAQTSPSSDVALLYDYDSRWAIEFQPHNRNYNVPTPAVNLAAPTVILGYYRALRDLTPSLDIVNPREDLSQYKLVVAPDLNVISDELAQHLLQYVQQGGHLILGPRSGMKDQFNALSPQRQPGPLVPALGGRVEQFYALLDTVSASGPLTGDKPAKITQWAETLSASSPDTQVILRYAKGTTRPDIKPEAIPVGGSTAAAGVTGGGWLDDQPAALSRPVGKGRLTYIGALLDQDALGNAATWMVQSSNVKPVAFPVPPGVEICRRHVPMTTRTALAHEVFILLNHGKAAAEIKLPAPMRDLLGTADAQTSITLPPRGVAVLTTP